MEDIAVLGAGVAGKTFIEKIRERDKQSKLTLIDRSRYHFCKKEIIFKPGKLNQNIELNEWAKEKDFDFINDSVERINLRRRKIYFKQQEPRSFDKLIIATGLASKKNSVKGDHREGFFYFSDIDPFKLKDLLRVSSEASVDVSTYLGLKLCLAIGALGKEVRLIASNLDFLGDYRERLIDFLKIKNIILHLGSVIEEAVGEGMVKAAKISPLKIFSSQLVFIDSGFRPNTKFLEEEVTFRDTFFTDFDGVYFLGDVNDTDTENNSFFIFNHENAERQGVALAEFFSQGKQPNFSKRNIGPEDIKTNIESIFKEGEVWQNGLV